MIKDIFTADEIRNIAEIYQNSPDKTEQLKPGLLYDLRKWVHDSLWMELQRHDKIYDIRFVTGQPYTSVADMTKQAHETGILDISTDYNDSPIWGQFVNLEFRAWHDLIHIRKSIIDCEFNLDGECCAFNGHLDYTRNENYIGVLFSEIIAQVCVLRVTGSFPEQKLVMNADYLGYAHKIRKAYGFQ